MSAAAFEPIPLQSLQRSLRPISRMVSPVAVGLEQVPRTGPVLFVGNHTIYGGLDVFMLGAGALMAKRGRDPDRYPVQRLPRGLAAQIN